VAATGGSRLLPPRLRHIEDPSTGIPGFGEVGEERGDRGPLAGAETGGGPENWRDILRAHPRNSHRPPRGSKEGFSSPGGGFPGGAAPPSSGRRFTGIRATASPVRESSGEGRNPADRRSPTKERDVPAEPFPRRGSLLRWGSAALCLWALGVFWPPRAGEPGVLRWLRTVREHPVRSGLALALVLGALGRRRRARVHAPREARSASESLSRARGGGFRRAGGPPLSCSEPREDRMDHPSRQGGESTGQCLAPTAPGPSVSPPREPP